MSTIITEAPVFRASQSIGTAAGPHQFDSWSTRVLRLRRVFRASAERRGQRRALAELTRLPHRLDDIGLTRAQALREARKRFWQR
jgi:uncharacterized protein YjiS (DUF1127 family)